MGFEPYVQNISRYSRTFDPIMPNAFVSPFYFMAANTTGVQGDALQYSSTIEDTVQIATSGIASYQIAGFLMQDVKQLDTGSLKGWRNPNNSIVNVGDNVGILQTNGPAMTKRYSGTPTLLNQLTVDPSASGKLIVYTGSNNTTGQIAIVEAVSSSATPTVEPSQYGGTAAPDFIRIRINCF